MVLCEMHALESFYVVKFESICLIFLQNFRQDYCRYDINLIQHLERIKNTTYCQYACQNVPRCNYFTYLKDNQVCKLQEANFETRVCDIVHGTASPSFQSCLDSGKILWANLSGNFLVFMI